MSEFDKWWARDCSWQLTRETQDDVKPVAYAAWNAAVEACAQRLGPEDGCDEASCPMDKCLWPDEIRKLKAGE